VPSIAVRTEPSSADPAVAIEQSGDASARAGSTGTAPPLALAPAGVAAGEPARPDVQPAQTATPATSSAAPASKESARDLGVQSPMP
jgi:hypothetical protein